MSKRKWTRDQAVFDDDDEDQYAQGYGSKKNSESSSWSKRKRDEDEDQYVDTRADKEDEDLESFVTIGTEQPHDISAVRARDRNKYLPVFKQEVRDEKGRKRLHGAFTGGFSAGYFNSVGSKEGWAPSQFVSSRSARASARAAKPEDFMDEDDMNEFGGEITAKDEFDFLGGTQRELQRRQAVAASDEGEIKSVLGALPMNVVEDILIGPAKDPIGVKLMRQMGWREGQGIGPRTRRKRLVAEADDEDIFAAEKLFAPAATQVVEFTSKKNQYGLGFDPHKNAPEFAAFGGGEQSASRDEVQKAGRSKKGPRMSSGFGVGIFEDDDDEDVYGSASMASYDIVIHDDDEGHFAGFKRKAGFGATVTDQMSSKSTKRTFGLDSDIFDRKLVGFDGRPPLIGFVFAKTPLAPPENFLPPVVPPNWKPNPPISDSTSKPAPSQTPATGQPGSQRQPQLTAEERREILGEEALKGPQRSVFSFISVKAQGRLQEIIDKTREASSSDGEAAAQVSKEQALAALQGFMPFGNDPEKQQRYKRYLEVCAGLSNKPLLAPPHMSEMELAHEKREFVEAARIYRPLSSMMASRFTSASNVDQEAANEKDAKEIQDETSSAAASANMYGKLTRTRQEWVPARLLCKRFNIAHPHPDRPDPGSGLSRSSGGKASGADIKAEAERKEAVNKRVMDDLVRERDRLVAEGRLQKRPAIEFASAREGPFVEIMGMEGSKKSNAAAEITAEEIMREGEGADEDEDVQQVERPPMDIFKAIFADSDSDPDEDEEDDAKGEDKDTGQTKRSIPAIPETDQPGSSKLPPKKPADAEEQPRLPPPTFRPIFTKREDRKKAANKQPKAEEPSVQKKEQAEPPPDDQATNSQPPPQSPTPKLAIDVPPAKVADDTLKPPQGATATVPTTTLHETPPQAELPPTAGMALDLLLKLKSQVSQTENETKSQPVSPEAPKQDPSSAADYDVPLPDGFPLIPNASSHERSSSRSSRKADRSGHKHEADSSSSSSDSDVDAGRSSHRKRKKRSRDRNRDSDSESSSSSDRESEDERRKSRKTKKKRKKSVEKSRKEKEKKKKKKKKSSKESKESKRGRRVDEVEDGRSKKEKKRGRSGGREEDEKWKKEKRKEDKQPSQEQEAVEPAVSVPPWKMRASAADFM
ncbi:hypothetical protein HK102_004933 [Quaeritorhiza haematococci]|nr:hypothetical protein HK102_004933 [Quaeritorhiza haematococci]